MSKLKYAVLILLISSAALLHADGIAKYLDSDGDTVMAEQADRIEAFYRERGLLE